MDEMNEKLPIGPEEVAEAAQILQRYKAGKAALDKRLVDNELWFRMSDAAQSGKYAWKYSISQNKNQDPLCSPFQHKNPAYYSAIHCTVMR